MKGHDIFSRNAIPDNEHSEIHSNVIIYNQVYGARDNVVVRGIKGSVCVVTMDSACRLGMLAQRYSGKQVCAPTP